MMSIRTYTDKRASVSCVYPDIVAVPSHFFVSLFGLFIDILVSVNFDVYHRLFRKHVSVVSSFKSGVRVRKTSTRTPGAKIMMSRHKKCTAKSGKALHSVVIQKQPTTTNNQQQQQHTHLRPSPSTPLPSPPSCKRCSPSTGSPSTVYHPGNANVGADDPMGQ